MHSKTVAGRISLKRIISHCGQTGDQTRLMRQAVDRRTEGEASWAEDLVRRSDPLSECLGTPVCDEGQRSCASMSQDRWTGIPPQTSV